MKKILIITLLILWSAIALPTDPVKKVKDGNKTVYYKGKKLVVSIPPLITMDSDTLTIDTDILTLDTR